VVGPPKSRGDISKKKNGRANLNDADRRRGEEVVYWCSRKGGSEPPVSQNLKGMVRETRKREMKNQWRSKFNGNLLCKEENRFRRVKKREKRETRDQRLKGTKNRGGCVGNKHWRGGGSFLWVGNLGGGSEGAAGAVVVNR